MNEIRNPHPDQRCLRVRNMWRTTSTIIGEHLSALLPIWEIWWPGHAARKPDKSAWEL